MNNRHTCSTVSEITLIFGKTQQKLISVTAFKEYSYVPEENSPYNKMVAQRIDQYHTVERVPVKGQSCTVQQDLPASHQLPMITIMEVRFCFPLLLSYSGGSFQHSERTSVHVCEWMSGRVWWGRYREVGNWFSVWIPCYTVLYNMCHNNRNTITIEQNDPTVTICYSHTVYDVDVEVHYKHWFCKTSHCAVHVMLCLSVLLVTLRARNIKICSFITITNVSEVCILIRNSIKK